MAKLLQEDFWNYSVKLYGQLPVKDACLLLQNHFSLNINILLFCCWYASNGGPLLLPKDLRRIIDTVDAWHKNITQEMRKVRILLGKTELRELYQESLQHELEAEKVEQWLIIYAMPPVASKRRIPSQSAKHAVANLQTYYTLTKTHLNPLGYQATKTLLTDAFPKLLALYDTLQITLPL